MTDRPLRLFSFDHTAPIGGVTTYQLRAALAFARYPDLGVEYHYVGNGTPDQVEHLVERLPPAARGRVHFAPRGLGKPAAAVARWVRSDPAAALRPDVVLPNNALEGWLYAARAGRRFGRAAGGRAAGEGRPCVVGGLHSDEERYYRMCGEQGPCDAVFGVSRHTVAEFARRYGPAAPPAGFVPYGVPTADAPPARPPGGPLRVVYLGGLVREQKRAQDLVPLARELVARGVDFEFHVAGDGAARAEVVDGLRAAAGPRAVYHGRISVWDVPTFLADKHVFVQTSEYEGTSLSLLEAMGQGVVPVVTDVASGVPDLIRQGAEGWRVPIGDVAAMADRVSRLAGDRPGLAAAAERAWRAATAGYSLRVAAERLAAFCRSALDRPRGPFRVTGRHPQWNRLDRAPLPDAVVRAARRIRQRLRKGPQ
jgi:glycosyltransferase involved in cell wall biosynthesis